MQQFRPDPFTRRMSIVGPGLGGFAPMISGRDFLKEAEEVSWQRRGAVNAWCGKYRDGLRRLIRQGNRAERRYATKMLALLNAAYRTCKEIAAELEQLLDRETAACHAAGERPRAELWEEGGDDDVEPREEFECDPDLIGWALA